jgi:excisionase family DNA binding protein
MNMQQKEIMSETEIAEMCGVNLRTMQRQRAEGKLPFPYVRVGDRVLYHRQAVMKAVKSRS